MRARTDAFLRFGEALARATTDPVRPAVLARSLDIPLTTVQEWVRHLRFQRALVEAGPGYRVDRPQLLAVYTAHRLTRLTPAFEMGTALDVAALGEILEHAGMGHAFALFTAANQWAFHEARRSHQIYVSRRDLRRLRGMLPPGGVALEVFPENVPPTSGAGSAAALPVVRRGGVHVTSAFLTLLDCRAHPEGGAHAEFLERAVLRWGAGA